MGACYCLAVPAWTQNRNLFFLLPAEAQSIMGRRSSGGASLRCFYVRADPQLQTQSSSIKFNKAASKTTINCRYGPVWPPKSPVETHSGILWD